MVTPEPSQYSLKREGVAVTFLNIHVSSLSTPTILWAYTSFSSPSRKMLTARSTALSAQTSLAAARPAARSNIRSIARVAAPSKEDQVVDVDNAERARLESSNAFAELVALNDKKQSVNRPQKVGGWLLTHVGSYQTPDPCRSVS
jgi:hypothetical protein